MKAFAKSTIRRVCRTRAFELLADGACSLKRCQPLLRILTYHRIDTPARRPEFYPGLISASPHEFERQIRFMRKRYRFVSINQILSALDDEQVLPANAVMLTFDDATTDFLKFAWPVLQRFHIPATVFVATSYPGQNRHFWWDQLYRAIFMATPGIDIPTPEGNSVSINNEKSRTALFRAWRKQLKSEPHGVMKNTLASIVSTAGVADPEDNNVLSWSLLRQLSDDGVSLAPHTRTHPMLNHLTGGEIRAEILGSHEELETNLEKKVPKILAYPAGGVNSEVVEIMSSLQFQLGFTTNRGCNSQKFDHPFLLNRINVGKNTTPSLIRLQFENWL